MIFLTLCTDVFRSHWINWTHQSHSGSITRWGQFGCHGGGSWIEVLQVGVWGILFDFSVLYCITSRSTQSTQEWELFNFSGNINGISPIWWLQWPNRVQYGGKAAVSDLIWEIWNFERYCKNPPSGSRKFGCSLRGYGVIQIGSGRSDCSDTHKSRLQVILEWQAILMSVYYVKSDDNYTRKLVWKLRECKHVFQWQADSTTVCAWWSQRWTPFLIMYSLCSANSLSVEKQKKISDYQHDNSPITVHSNKVQTTESLH